MEKVINLDSNIDIAELHADFQHRVGVWVFNHFWNPEDGAMSCKIRAGFDEVEVLNGISFSAKIGINTDPQIPHKYILFAYGSKDDGEALRELATRFPYSELISNTGSSGNTKEGSSVERVV